jgi:hypothetical protein
MEKKRTKTLSYKQAREKASNHTQDAKVTRPVPLTLHAVLQIQQSTFVLNALSLSVFH